jgi:hypothetical protein
MFAALKTVVVVLEFVLFPTAETFPTIAPPLSPIKTPVCVVVSVSTGVVEAVATVPAKPLAVAMETPVTVPPPLLPVGL